MKESRLSDHRRCLADRHDLPTRPAQGMEILDSIIQGYPYKILALLIHLTTVHHQTVDVVMLSLLTPERQ